LKAIGCTYTTGCFIEKKKRLGTKQTHPTRKNTSQTFFWVFIWWVTKFDGDRKGDKYSSRGNSD